MYVVSWLSLKIKVNYRLGLKPTEVVVLRLLEDLDLYNELPDSMYTSSELLSYKLTRSNLVNELIKFNLSRGMLYFGI